MTTMSFVEFMKKPVVDTLVKRIYELLYSIPRALGDGRLRDENNNDAMTQNLLSLHRWTINTLRGYYYYYD